MWCSKVYVYAKFLDVSSSLNIQLSTDALRKALDLLESGHYASLDELVETLILEGNSHVGGQWSGRDLEGPPRAATHLLTARPPKQAAIALAEPVEPSGQLQFLTNRFGPLKLSTRVLAGLSRDGQWPELADFHSHAAATARHVGQRLRREDVEEGRRGAERRWVAYPVGKDERAATDRFIFSFGIFAGDLGASGPLAQLGLANVADGRAVLTARGWELAAVDSPTLDGDSVGTLSQDEISILRACLLQLPEEASAITEFLRAVRMAAGAQGRVDELLGAWHHDWTADRAAAERSAMLGRLGELGVVRVSGRGPVALIELLNSREFENK
jgi:hypothetical protein